MDKEESSTQRSHVPTFPSDLADSDMFKILAADGSSSSSLETSLDGVDAAIDANKIQLMKAKLVLSNTLDQVCNIDHSTYTEEEISKVAKEIFERHIKDEKLQLDAVKKQGFFSIVWKNILGNCPFPKQKPHKTREEERDLAKKIIQKITENAKDQCIKQLKKKAKQFKSRQKKLLQKLGCVQRTTSRVWNEVQKKLQMKIPEPTKRKHITEIVSRKIGRLNRKIAEKRARIVQKLSQFQEEIEFFTPKEKKVLLNGSQLNKQIGKLTKEIITAETQKKVMIDAQTKKRDKLENNVNQLIAKKYVLEAIQREEKEWAEKRVQLEKLQREQFGELVKKYQKKKNLLQKKLKILEKKYSAGMKAIKKSSQYEMQSLRSNAEDLLNEGENVKAGISNIKSAVEKSSNKVNREDEDVISFD